MSTRQGKRYTTSGVATLKWSDLRNHEAEIRWLLANVEARAVSVNPLDRGVKIVRRKKELEVQMTNDRLAQRIGRALVQAYKKKLSTAGPIAYDGSGKVAGA
jgi:hypothetical protein